MRAPTGEQFELSRTGNTGHVRAIITELAASLRVLEVDGVAVTQPYSVDTLPPFGCGIVLAPWPNRVADGIWRHEGVERQLDITEPDRHNAIHGLLRNAPYTVVERSDSAITLAATVFPQHGYPFYLETSVRYELVDHGMRVTHSATNRSAEAAPVAFGVHPFFRVGDAPVEDLVLTSSATSRFETDARLNPVGEVTTEATGYDLRAGRRVGDLELDDAFGGLVAGDGLIRTTLTAPDGSAVELWQEPDWAWIQVFTTRSFPGMSGEGGAGSTSEQTLAVAIEPMTAPPNAFNSGLGVRWLAEDETWSTSWGVSYTGAGVSAESGPVA